MANPILSIAKVLKHSKNPILPLDQAATIFNTSMARQTLSVEEAAAILGIGRSKAYELVRADQWPTPVRRIGRRYLILSGPLLAFVSGADDSSTRAA